MHVSSNVQPLRSVYYHATKLRKHKTISSVTHNDYMLFRDCVPVFSPEDVFTLNAIDIFFISERVAEVAG